MRERESGERWKASDDGAGIVERAQGRSLRSETIEERRASRYDLRRWRKGEFIVQAGWTDESGLG